MKKVLLISIDGMRPDGLKACGNPYLSELEKICSYTYSASSVFPSVTFPCHFSMTHSVSPQRHGILTNTYVPQVRPIKGIFEKVNEFGGTCAFFYGWEPLRDICPPGALKFATYINAYTKESCDTVLTDECEKLLTEVKPDFAFLYMVETDEKGGHDNGWMSDEYLRRISIAIDNVKRMIEKFGDEYSVIIMADHGGHDRSHGSDAPEDMTIPLFFYGEDFEKGKVIDKPISLLNIAPTIAKILGLPAEPDWDGTPIF
ncbi:MAG: alkaline phosphatase family protein [Clostridia bacterium]|nr:alkaline phosphatase family protein [Clostridia bacterium]